jgi:hypothetical protein
LNDNGSTTSGTLTSTPSVEEELGLTSTQPLIATDSAELKNLKVTELISAEKLENIDATISNSLKVLGETSLGNTLIAGDVTVDGTFSITDGSKVNALPTLYFQTQALAEAVDFFNGLVTIDKTGKIQAKEIVADQIKVTKTSKIADNSAGQATLKAGDTEIAVFNNLIKSDSIVIITPETVGAPVMVVSDKVAGAGFVVKVNLPLTKDIKFSYLIVGQSSASN